MRRLIAAVVLVLATPALAAPPRKIMVLPLDGNADRTTRAKISVSVQRLARVMDGQITTSNTTLADTAVVVGCDPKEASCAEAVRVTLGVDELVYGTVTSDKGQLTVVVRRKVKDTPPRERIATMADKDSPSTIEPTLLTLFNGSAEPGPEIKPLDPDPKPPDPKPPDPKGPDAKAPDGPVAETPQPVTTPEMRSRRALSIAAVAGGGTMLLIGIALWSSKQGIQSDIDNAPTETEDQLRELRDLEGKASTRAWAGNALVLAGLALGGYGAWVLYKDHKAPPVVVTPMKVEGGAGVWIVGAFR